MKTKLMKSKSSWALKIAVYKMCKSGRQNQAPGGLVSVGCYASSCLMLMFTQSQPKWSMFKNFIWPGRIIRIGMSPPVRLIYVWGLIFFQKGSHDDYLITVNPWKEITIDNVLGFWSRWQCRTGWKHLSQIPDNNITQNCTHLISVTTDILSL